MEAEAVSREPGAGDIVFADDKDGRTGVPFDGAWKILIVDDESEVHNVTKLALDSFSYANKKLEFISAYSGKEAKEILSSRNDIALTLLDVVMETDDAGLEVARFIREDINNIAIRIILRTGQPGMAPERDVIRDYDINDYKEKTELTSQKLFSVMYAGLRSYRDIIALENSKRGLEEIIQSSTDIFELKSMEKFAHGVLTQLSSLLHLNKGFAYCSGIGMEQKFNGQLRILAGTGKYDGCCGAFIQDVVGPDILPHILEAVKKEQDIFLEKQFIAFFKSKSGAQNMLFFDHDQVLDEVDRNLITIFLRNVSVAFDNVCLKQEIEDTQRDIVYRLGEAVEMRSLETGNHVKRVAEYSRLLAFHYGLGEEEAEIICLASPMHDVGKVGIPDGILHKGGQLEDEEWEIMKTHSDIGYEMLKGSTRRILKTAAIIAHEHHERWDGTGYPEGKAGDDIDIVGRITMLADVFDALGSDRCYKKAWELDRILEYLRAGRGTQFDPDLIDIFFAHMPEFLAIRDQYVDTYIGE